MWNQLRYAFTHLVRTPKLSLFLILILAVGIGAGTAIFSSARSLSLNSLPIQGSAQLVFLHWIARPELPDAVLDGTYDFPGGVSKMGTESSASFSYQTFLNFRSQSETLEDVFAFAPLGKSWYGENKIAISSNGQLRLAIGTMVSSNYFAALGLRPALGRFIIESDEKTGRAVAVISFDYWKSEFGQDARAVGASIELQGVPYVVIGVAPRHFSGLVQGIRTDFWVPMSGRSELTYWGAPSTQLKDPKWWGLTIFGKLKAGQSRKNVQSELSAIFWRSIAENLNSSTISKTNLELTVESGAQGLPIVANLLLRPLSILVASAVLLLVVVSANGESLVLAHLGSRRKEIALRLALGISPAILGFELLVEALLISTAAAILGSFVAYWTNRGLVVGLSGVLQQVGLDLPQPHLNASAIGIGAITALCTGILVGFVPSVFAGRVDLASALKAGMRSSSDKLDRRFALHRAFVVFQIVVSLTLLVAAGVFVRTVHGILTRPFGFNTHQLLVFGVTGHRQDRVDEEMINASLRLQDELRNQVGVQSATSSLLLPVAGHGSMLPISTFGSETGAVRTIDGHINMVGSDFFETLQTPIVAGRGFNESDRKDSPKVAVLSETSSKRLFGTSSSVGRLIRVNPNGPVFTIVGVVQDADYESPYESFLREPQPTVFLPYIQMSLRGFNTLHFEVRSLGSTASIVDGVRRVAGHLSGQLALSNVETEEDVINRSLATEHLLSDLAILLGVLSLVLAPVGLAATFSYMVGKRSHEIGIRLALGSERRQILWAITKPLLSLVVIGVLGGSLSSYGITQWIAREYYGVKAMDILTTFGAISVVLVMTTGAALVPLRRATKLDPVVVLRMG